MSNRLRLKEKRTQLREERMRASDLDAQLVGAIRRVWEQDQAVDKDSLSVLYEQVQAARDELGPLEDDYNQEEDENNVAEFQLIHEEKQFYRLMPADTSTDDMDNADHSSLPSSFSSLDSFKGDAADSPETRKLALEEYVSRVGDANIVMERLENLRLERVEYLEEQRTRSRMDVELYPPNKVFLDDFDYTYAHTKQELDQVLVDLERLRQKALQEGATADQLVSPSVPRFVWEREPQPKYDQAPALFPEHQSDSVVPDLVNNFAGTRARINRWILDTLNSSPVERAHHKAILRALSDRSLNSETWARSVFAYWRRDKAATDHLEDLEGQDPSGFVHFEEEPLGSPPHPIRRYYTEQAPIDDRQLYDDGNPLLTSEADNISNLDNSTLPYAPLSESDLYSPFLESRSV